MKVIIPFPPHLLRRSANARRVSVTSRCRRIIAPSWLLRKEQTFDHFRMPSNAAPFCGDTNFRQKFRDLSEAQIVPAHVPYCFNHASLREVSNDFTLLHCPAVFGLGGISVWEMSFPSRNSQADEVFSDSLFGGKNL